ncbi:hypothetical protein OGAPHI_002405 [Ogataea philodendri]|uniref:Uncharacterized protein n=1 Tax=Ogataea philodendri TaxID=1378263 RepID=A0A9P8PBD8_9ASCO|nr:uncharacterized protein OGAPHI_002405 [Ogataea philodendri]KAH3668651.1 hypothetical protein OGAPHI_002405 [Ogataea philodendri]
MLDERARRPGWCFLAGITVDASISVSSSTSSSSRSLASLTSLASAWSRSYSSPVSSSSRFSPAKCPYNDRNSMKFCARKFGLACLLRTDPSSTSDALSASASEFP